MLSFPPAESSRMVFDKEQTTLVIHRIIIRIRPSHSHGSSFILADSNLLIVYPQPLHVLAVVALREDINEFSGTIG